MAQQLICGKHPIIHKVSTIYSMLVVMTFSQIPLNQTLGLIHVLGEVFALGPLDLRL